MTRKTGGDTKKYRYGAGWDVLNEEDGSGNLQATYIHSSCGGSATPGKQIGTVLATSEGTSAATGTWAYYFQDAIGSTRGLWDQDGDRIGKYEYTPFGGKYADHGEDITGRRSAAGGKIHRSRLGQRGPAVLYCLPILQPRREPLADQDV
ncbi:MAG: hypothetical protein KF886_16890 [Candidatus Hydrogenedentes bacterium]|nr:hypothetical protein [Candidatus Hydrogenedentota bacterium]